MITDTHCHYNLEPFFSPTDNDSWKKHWQKAQENGVKKSIVVGTDFLSSNIAIQIAESDPNLSAAIGLHPTEIEKSFQTNFEKLSLLLPNPKIVAIGETGLDYFHFADDSQKEIAIKTQQAIFRAHIQLAKKHKLHLIIHVRDKNEQAYWDVLKILKDEKYTGTFILHCISGPIEYVRQAVEMGAYIGMAGNITYKNAEHLRDLVKSVPQDRLLLETDAPFLPPQAFRGQTCEPWMISQTAEFVEKELHIPLEHIFQNSLRLLQ